MRGNTMTLNEMIYHRRSCRSFLGQPVDSETIEKILSFEMKPLYPEIKVRMDIVSRNQVKCICPWTTPQPHRQRAVHQLHALRGKLPHEQPSLAGCVPGDDHEDAERTCGWI